MKRILFLSFLLCWCLSMTAQRNNKFYKQSVHAEGALYFVNPQTMPEIKGNKTYCSKPLSYDYTYLDSRDSVTLLMTIVSKNIYKPDYLQVTGSIEKQYPLELIYCEMAKKGWKSRLKCQIPYDDWKKLYHAAVPFVLEFHAVDGEVQPRFSDKPRSWKKLCDDFIRLQELIDVNKKY